MCQISSKSLEPRPWYGVFGFFKMAAAAILDFGNFEFLTVGRVTSVELRHLAEFRRNRSNCGRDIEIFRFFKKADAAMLYFKNFNFLWSERSIRSKCISVPNFVEIALTAAEIWNLIFLTFVVVKRIELHNRTKFRWNRLKRCRDMVIFPFFKMAAAAILDFRNLKILTFVGHECRTASPCQISSK